MLNVFDRFSRESQDLLYSLQRAGYTHPRSSWNRMAFYLME